MKNSNINTIVDTMNIAVSHLLQSDDAVDNKPYWYNVYRTNAESLRKIFNENSK